MSKSTDFPFHLKLASKSPRRQGLLKEMGIDFEQVHIEVREDYPAHLQGAAIAEFLARKKAQAYPHSELKDGDVLLTSDTVVWHKGESLAKANSAAEAAEMLRKLSGQTHQVITACCLRSLQKEVVFSDVCQVTFAPLSEGEIEHYIEHFQPFDKAGAYGIQEWIGMIGIEKIEGSYFSIVGLPTQKLYQQLKSL